MYNLKFIML